MKGDFVMISKKLLMAGLLVAAGLSNVGFAADAAKGAAAAAPVASGPSLDYKTMPAGTYVLDPTHASVVWKVMHMGFSNFAGRFDKISGTATVNPADLSKSGVVVSIASDSGDTGVEKLDDELEQKDFFNAEAYPAITFTSTKIEVTGKNAAGRDTGKIYGMLSMKGVTKPAVLDVTFNGHGPNPMMATQQRMGFEASTTIKRSEFGFTHLLPVVGDEVQLIIAVEFTKA